ncbi:cell envelope integrity protein TolA [Paucibacter sp. XJ19-41]|uniref:cell envelope integrity protein TolA n=1 Tax=Paucibacter sp. XJ19-41 TaxID=2927824 RepID=UPI002349708B|nr:cell envelope integrity protein TolA [Paucibacter sp. XJ19-41]MDC6165869.1 cell envelope integrity protein TolA [Paucibacter sp. XJ19-41]
MSSSTFAPTGFDASRPPPSAGLGRGFALALLAHGLLIIALTAGVQWRSKTEPAFEAELWAAVPVAAAPREEAPPPEPEPVVKPAPAKPEPPPPDLQAQRDAEIAIAKAREKKREELEAKRLAELEEQRKQKLRELQEQKDKAAKDAKTLKEQQAKEQKLKDDKARQDSKKAEALAEKRAEAQRQENLRRIQGMAGASGGPQATGTALQSAGPSPSYGGRIKARIRPNIIYSESGAGNPVAEVEVRAAADGHIIGRKLLKSSGDAEWDKAVLRAIDKTEMLPRDVDGRVPSVLVISFQPKD